MDSNYMISDEFIIESFKCFLNNIVTQIKNSYEGNHYDLELQEDLLFKGEKRWVKLSETDFRFNFDLFKSDSLLNPYIGYLEMKNIVAVYGNFDRELHQFRFNSKQEAEMASDIVDFWDGRHYKFTYGYQNGQWVKIKIERIDNLLGAGDWEEIDLNHSEYEFFCNDKIRD